MKTISQYTSEVLTVVMNNLKNGVSGSTIADMMVSNYGFEREAALTIITGTILMLNKANLI
jgi:cytochrome c-type biogenesis protein CcmH/NrfF